MSSTTKSKKIHYEWTQLWFLWLILSLLKNLEAIGGENWWKSEMLYDEIKNSNFGEYKIDYENFIENMDMFCGKGLGCMFLKKKIEKDVTYYSICNRLVKV